MEEAENGYSNNFGKSQSIDKDMKENEAFSEL